MKYLYEWYKEWEKRRFINKTFFLMVKAGRGCSLERDSKDKIEDSIAMRFAIKSYKFRNF